MIESTDTTGASAGGSGERTAHRPSEMTTLSSPRPHPVNSYTRDPGGGGSVHRLMTPP